MSKRRVSDRVDENEPRPTGGLAETNCGILLGEIVASRSWTAVVAIIVLVSIFVRAAVGLGGYSGTLHSIEENWRNDSDFGHRAWKTADAWRFWSAETLARINSPCTPERMVFSWLAMVGIRLSSLDRIYQLAFCKNVSSWSSGDCLL